MLASLPPDRRPGLTQTPDQIEAQARAGHVPAQMRLAQMFDAQGRHDAAMTWLEQAAHAGDLTAGTVIGCRWLAGRGAPFEPARGAAWIHRTAGLGGAEALVRASVLTALGHGTTSSWTTAVEQLRRAATGRAPGAEGQIRTLGADRPGFDVEAWLTPPAARTAIPAPRILIFPELASPAECGWLRTLSADRLGAQRVYDPATGQTRLDPMRTSRGAAFGLMETDLVLAGVRERLARASGHPTPHFEPTNVLNYQIGQQYEPHFDFINPEEAGFARELGILGQRRATALIYLNDDYEGGETAFPELDWSFKATAGDALIFFNVDDDDRPDKRTLHAGLPPTSGEKWVLSQWIRDRPQPIV